MLLNRILEKLIGYSYPSFLQTNLIELDFSFFRIKILWTINHTAISIGLRVTPAIVCSNLDSAGVEQGRCKNFKIGFSGTTLAIAVMSSKQPRTNLDFPTMTSKMNSDLFKKSSLLIRLHSLESTSKPCVQSLNLNIDKAKSETTERPQAHTHQQNRRSVSRV